MEIIMRPIGYISSPYQNQQDTPRQGKHKPQVTAMIILDEKYKEGLLGLQAGMQCVVLFNFHKSDDYRLITNSHETGLQMGVFATRSPHRPNGIGMSMITITNITDNIIEFTGVDMLDGTPVLDIKPYVAMLDN